MLLTKHELHQKICFLHNLLSGPTLNTAYSINPFKQPTRKVCARDLSSSSNSIALLMLPSGINALFQPITA